MTNWLLNDSNTNRFCCFFSCPLIRGRDKRKHRHPFDLGLFDSEWGCLSQNKAKSSLVI